MTRILLADDDPSVTGSLSIFLQAEHDVEVVCNGSEAYNRLATNSFSLAILDWDMPEMTGPEICEQYRSLGGLTPIILLTGRTSDENKETGFDVGADDYLTKPFSLKELGARVKSLLRRSAQVPAASLQSQVNKSAVRICVSCGKQYAAEDETANVCRDDGSATVVIVVEKLVGLILGGCYKVESLLGVGAWSEVYKARHVQTGEVVATKILHTHLSSDPLKIARFNREAEALMRLQHPFIARVFGQTNLPNGRPCLIMEYLDGVSLERHLSRHGKLTLAQAKHFFPLLCQGLTCAHEQDLIHRDLKPSNVFIVYEKGMVVPKILDFGMAKMLSDDAGAMASLTQSGEVLGTPAYMSPEQCLGSALDARCDLYSLGCLVYECLTGVRAIPGKSAFEAMSNQLSRTPHPMNQVCPSAEISPQVEDVVFKLLSKDPDGRYSTAREFSEAFVRAN